MCGQVKYWPKHDVLGITLQEKRDAQIQKILEKNFHILAIEGGIMTFEDNQKPKTKGCRKNDGVLEG